MFKDEPRSPVASRGTFEAGPVERPGSNGPNGRVRVQGVLSTMLDTGLGSLLAASAEGTLVVFEPRVAPGRFCVSQKENGLRHADPGKVFWNK